MVQIGGTDSNSAERRLLVIGATNRPEDLDEVARYAAPQILSFLRQICPKIGIHSAKLASS